MSEPQGRCRYRAVVLISANGEWRAIRALYRQIKEKQSPLGEWFTFKMALAGWEENVLFFHGGWGKIAAAASAQYVIDRWHPTLLVNLGTCGGFAGEIEQGAIVLAERTLVYDIVEQMDDPQEAIVHYTTALDLSWLREPYPYPVRRTLLVSGDRDLIPVDIPWLRAEFGAVAGDWESGAIAYVAARNRVRCLILRGVTDLVSEKGGEAYGDRQFFVDAAAEMMPRLVESLPAWLQMAL